MVFENLRAIGDRIGYEVVKSCRSISGNDRFKPERALRELNPGEWKVVGELLSHSENRVVGRVLTSSTPNQMGYSMLSFPSVGDRQNIKIYYQRNIERTRNGGLISYPRGILRLEEQI